MTKEKQFLLMAADLTGESVANIKVIECQENSNGLLSGTVEIDGRFEYLHEYHN